MGKRTNQKGRSSGQGRFITLNEYLLKSAAYRSLSNPARCLLVEIKRRYNGSNNGDIIMSHREAEKLINRSNRVVNDAFKELQDRGFIRPQQKGCFDWKARADGRASRATTWLLTEYPADLPIRHLVPEKTFMEWKPDPSEKKTRYAPRTPYGTRHAHHKKEMVRDTHTIGTRDAHHEGQNPAPDGTRDAYTNRYTISPPGFSEHHLHISKALPAVLRQKKKGAG